MEKIVSGNPDGAERFRRLHPDWIAASRLGSAVFYSIPLLAAAALTVLAAVLDWNWLPPWLGGLITLALALLLVFAAVRIPVILYKRFGFAVFEEEIEIRKGLFFITETLIPMTKVQHVELESGPILRRYKLAEIRIVTAATTHTIAGLKSDEAERLKRTIGELARRTEE
ncbi:PH domain-containing protein [Saccharibacillus sp. CPCC 101409]|uniref:PH domain-containing protein n=1 Tax=Saccharibacillus sp. CPCC 101409 TaxID=3058041 RepID=UPI0026712D8E|nr:PH domain-containing protein [Saccharibacillus sp. CPCC 101409]MDO3412267.1 PH domain-containing protein [Saccharibacillus sp. CPCC 101409]